MSSLKFVIFLLGSTALAIVAGLSINLAIDPYSVFGSKLLPKFGQVEERYLKIEYLKSHPHFNTFLLGSSRIGVIRTEDVNAVFRGAQSYNMTASQSNQWDAEKNIEWLIKNIPNLSRVIVQIDWPWTYGEAKPGYELLTAVHPDISGRNKFRFLSDYLTLFNMEAINAKFVNNFGGANTPIYDMSNGYWSMPIREKQISGDCSYAEKEPAFHIKRPATSKTSPQTLLDSLASIERYKALLDKASVKLTIILTPQNRLAIDPIDFEDYEMFIKRLANITEFYDFMYYNKLTKNDCNYYEASHYRPIVGKIILHSLTDQSDANSEIFKFVSKDNLDEKLKFFKANFSSERAD